MLNEHLDHNVMKLEEDTIPETIINTQATTNGNPEEELPAAVSLIPPDQEAVPIAVHLELDLEEPVVGESLSEEPQSEERAENQGGAAEITYRIPIPEHLYTDISEFSRQKSTNSLTPQSTMSGIRAILFIRSILTLPVDNAIMTPIIIKTGSRP